MYFETTYKKAATRVNLLRSIRPSVDQKCAETIYITMILLFKRSHAASLGLGWSDGQKSPIKNIEQRSLAITGNKGPSIEIKVTRKSG